MAKTLSVAALLFLVLSLMPSCKKCYTCKNACTSCVLKDSTGAVISLRQLYSDSLSYRVKKDSLATAGYTCTAAPSTYSIDFCVNTKNAEPQYLLYYEGNGRYTCNPK
jgi:hypothetical protein